MKSLKAFAEQLTELLEDIEKNQNSHEARIKLPEVIAGIQYHYSKASYRLARLALIISIIAIILNVCTKVI